jgi:hypothetical protein
VAEAVRITSVDVFISHSDSSDATAEVLAEKLQASGLNVFLGRQDGSPDEQWDRIRKALDTADAFVVLIDQHTQVSTSARRELGEILKRTWDNESKVIVPVVIGEAELPGFLRDMQAVRIEEEGSVEAVVSTVSRRLTQDPGGVHRSEAGEARLKERLTDLEDRAAQELADDEDA